MGRRLAVLALNTFGHFHTTADQLRALAALQRCLVPGGLLAVDVPNPDPLDLAGGDGLTLLHWQKTDPGTGRTVQKWLTSETDRAAQMQHYTLTYDEFSEDGIVRRTAVSMPIRYTYRFEAELLLERSGFALEQMLGTYAGDDYVSDSPRMIWIARRR